MPAAFAHGLYLQGNDNFVLGNDIHDNGVQGIRCSSGGSRDGGGHLIAYNQIHNNGNETAITNYLGGPPNGWAGSGFGFDTYANGGNLLIFGNVVHDNYANGIYVVNDGTTVYAYADFIIIARNRVYNNGTSGRSNGHGIIIGGNRFSSIFGNTVFDNLGAGIRIMSWGSQYPVYDSIVNNKIFNTSSGHSQAYGIYDGGDVNVDYLLVAENYLFNNGVNLSLAGPNNDIQRLEMLQQTLVNLQ